ncbi:MAG: type II toxin-antitoxin system MqsA family antitoxin [Nitrospinae bacterium]|nr:type II toxin-antitoxin system MqsA family antitoxin [Nitrospinota bacterium]
MKKDICLKCGKESMFIVERPVEVFNVRGEPIEVEVEYYKCLVCGDKFEDSESDYDPFNEAYREYRRRHGMVQPEKIKSFRERYGLTQRELSKLLGWGGATLSRYENGSLQDEAHETALRLAMEPSNLLRLITDKPGAVEEGKRSRLIKELGEAKEEEYASFRFYSDLSVISGTMEGELQVSIV